LFERLEDLEPLVHTEPQPYRVFDEGGLEESVRRALGRILNSRSHHNATVEPYVRGTVLAYGIPDATAFSPASETDRVRLAELIARAIEAYEPRLREVRVSLAPDPSNPRAMTGSIGGRLVADSIDKPVSFPLAVEGDDVVSAGGLRAEGATP
jgi:type VI secretion system lysozyme-like protein